MTGRSVVLAMLGLGVVAAAITLAYAVRTAGDASPHAAGSAAPSRRVAVAPNDRPPAMAAPVNPSKFVAPAGHAAPVRDPAARFPIPDGGFAKWTGREGTWPGDMEAFAQTAGISLPVALEQHRSTLLEERTRDPARLAELLGKPPTAEMLAAIDAQVREMHDTTARIQVDARAGTLSDATAIDRTRAAEDAYGRAYEAATGLSDAQFEGFFAADRPLP